jgi:hypothetical protein
MFVRLNESPKRQAGKWTDAATGEHGDLFDIIRESCGLLDFREVADEAQREGIDMTAMPCDKHMHSYAIAEKHSGGDDE